MAAPKIVKVDPTEIPEVVEFMDAAAALDEFKAAHPDIFTELEGLIDKYNTTRQQADQAVRARKVSSGPFDLYQFRTTYDAQALYDALGREEFLAVGGKVGTKATYEVDEGRLEACIAQNKLSADVVAKVRKVGPSYHAPKDIVMP